MSGIGDQARALARPNFGWLALVSALALTFVGIVAIETVEPGFAASQKQKLPIALAGMAVMMLPHPRLLGAIAHLMFGVSLVLLIVLLLPFMPRSIVPVINGARSWYDTPGMNFQPSEMCKVFYVLSLAWYLRYRDNHRTLLGLIPPFIFMVVPVLLILKQPDLGTALVFAPALLLMLVAAGAKLWHLCSVISLGVLLVGVNIAIVLYAPPDYQVLKPHQQRRITSMIKLASGDTSEVQDDAYQQYKAMNLSSSGGIHGYGQERSTTIFTYYSLPESHNDMIFAVIANRWGLFGAVGVIGMYGLLICSFLGVAATSKDPLGRLSSVGFAAMIFTQVVINVGMTLGVMPITGITLPFISYGGSSLLFTYAMLGLVLNFASRRPAMMARESFEFSGRRSAAY